MYNIIICIGVARGGRDVLRPYQDVVIQLVRVGRDISRPARHIDGILMSEADDAASINTVRASPE